MEDTDINIYFGKVTIQYSKNNKQLTKLVEMVYTVHDEGFKSLKQRCANDVNKEIDEISIIMHETERKIVGTRNVR